MLDALNKPEYKSWVGKQYANGRINDQIDMVNLDNVLDVCTKINLNPDDFDCIEDLQTHLNDMGIDTYMNDDYYELETQEYIYQFPLNAKTASYLSNREVYDYELNPRPPLCIISSKNSDDMYITSKGYSLILNTGEFMFHMDNANQSIEEAYMLAIFSRSLLAVNDKYMNEKLCSEFLQHNPDSLSSIPSIMRTRRICEQAVKYKGTANLYHVSDKTYQMCVDAVKASASNLNAVPEEFRTRELFEAMVENNKRGLQSVPKDMRDLGICQLALNADRTNKHWVPDDILVSILNFSEEVQSINEKAIPLSNNRRKNIFDFMKEYAEKLENNSLELSDSTPKITKKYNISRY